MSEVHSEGRETHSTVGCGTRRRGSRSQGRRIASNGWRSSKHSSPIPMRTAAEAVALKEEGSPPTVGGRASTAARSQCAPSLGSGDIFRSTKVAGIRCPVAVPTCASCRSNTNDSGHTQFQARSIREIFVPS